MLTIDIMDIIQSKQGCLYIICHLCRPGALAFLTELEHRHYEPDTPMNDLFNLFNVTYDGGMHYVIEIPAGSLAFNQASLLAEECNLKLVNGKPFNGYQEFPVNCLADHCFVLETISHDFQSAQGSYKQELKKIWEKNNL